MRKTPNRLLVADTQQQVAAARRLLRAEQRQRWADPKRHPPEFMT